MVDHKTTDLEKTDAGSQILAPVDEAVDHTIHVDPSLYIDPIVEKKLLRKIDSHVMTIFGLLYLFCFLDRGNIGSANVATPSISQSLSLSPQQYGAVVSVVYATYVVFEPVWSNALKILSPKIVLSGCTLIWGTITICTAFAKDYNHMIAIRVLLGVFEAGLFPCLTVYVMMNYRREETGRRMSMIFSCAAFAGAFGGLIGYGLVRIESGTIVGWQFLYIVEGALTLLLAPLAYFWVPNKMTEAWFLNAEQKELAAKRYEINKRHFDEKESFRWSEVRKALTDWKIYSSGAIQFAADVTLYGISTFMPQIIKAMGYSNVMAQALTVPVYVFGGLFFMMIAYFSDRVRTRSYFIVFGLSLNLIGYILLATVESVGGRYFALYVISAGIYITPGLNVTWISNNTAGHFKRSTAVGMNQLIGNSSGAAIGSIFLSTLAPRYLQSMYICMGITAFGILAAIGQALIYKRVNQQRDEACRLGAEDRPDLGDANPHFRYYL